MNAIRFPKIVVHDVQPDQFCGPPRPL